MHFKNGTFELAILVVAHASSYEFSAQMRKQNVFYMVCMEFRLLGFEFLFPVSFFHIWWGSVQIFILAVLQADLKDSVDRSITEQ